MSATASVEAYRWRDVSIDVVMRTGGRDNALLHRAVASLTRQSAGRVRLILVRHGSADVASLDALQTGALDRIVVVEAPGANRSAAMAAGLAHVTAPKFALLDDDDYLLDDHFLHLLHASQTVASPSLAYADILALDDATGALSVWREGAAKAPLGHITNRISAHAFLADTAALEGVGFRSWTLETAEDALLIASLLVRATPVHSPHATCVYAMGRGDGSAYLLRKDRAADELAFAQMIAPVVTMIEAKFDGPKSDPAVFLEPFVSAARRADLFADLRRCADGRQAPAICNDRSVPTVARSDRLAVLHRPLIVEPLAGTVVEGAEGSIHVQAEQDYVYAATVRFVEAAEARPVTVAIEVEASAGVFGIALVDEDHAIVEEATMEPLPCPVEVQLVWTRPGAPRIIVRRLAVNATAEPPRLTLRRLTLAYDCETLTPGQGQGAAQAALDDAARKPTIVGAPPPPDRYRAPVSLSLDGVGEQSAVINLGEAPWAYAASFQLPLEVDGSVLRVDLHAVMGSAYLLRVDGDWNQVGERLAAPVGAQAVEVWMAPAAAAGPTRLVIQAGAAPGDRSLTLRGVILYADAGAERPTAP